MKFTKRQLQATLRESVFTPKDPGHLGPIMDVGDTTYYVKRARELLGVYLREPNTVFLTTVITLLALAKLETTDV